MQGAQVVSSIEALLEALEIYKNEKEIYILGGGTVYKQLMPFAERLYITHVFDSFEADTFFPEINDEWEVDSVTADKENLFHEHPHVFVVYKRK